VTKRIELELYAEVSDLLGRFDETAPYIVVTNEPQLKGDASLLGVAKGRGDTRIRDWNYKVGFGGALSGKLLPEALADLVDPLTPQGGVRPGKVQVLKDAAISLRRRERLKGRNAAAVKDHDLTRLNVADILTFYEVEAAGL